MLNEWLNKYKDNFSCLNCKEKENCCLDFHHRNKEDKILAVATMVQRRTGIKKISEEIKKCEILCSNCHRKLHAGVIKLKNNLIPSNQ